MTVSNAALQAAAAIVSNIYRGIDDKTPSRIVNMASQLIDEIEARGTDKDVPQD